jgi:hypothetical protein
MTEGVLDAWDEENGVFDQRAQQFQQIVSWN